MVTAIAPDGSCVDHSEPAFYFVTRIIGGDEMWLEDPAFATIQQARDFIKTQRGPRSTRRYQINKISLQGGVECLEMIPNNTEWYDLVEC